MTCILAYIDYWHFLKFPSHILLVVHGVIIASLCCSIFSFRKTAYIIWEKINNHSLISNNEISKNLLISIFFLLTLSLGIVIYYNFNFPIKDTTLWHILCSSSNIDYSVSLEKSLKLINSSCLKYLYTFYQNTITPIILLSTIHYIGMIKDRIKIKSILILFFICIFVVLNSNFNVTKSSLLNYTIVILFFIVWKNNLNIIFYYMYFPFILLFSIIIVYFFITQNYSSYKDLENIFSRIFIIPLKMGSWYMHYTQYYGMIGVKEFPKIASFLSMEGVHSPNIIGKLYGPYYYKRSVLESIHANASFLFSFYRAFELFSCLISTLLILALDLILIILKRLRKGWLVIALSMLSYQSTLFASSSYTTILFSGGVIVSIFLIYFLDQFLPIMYSFLLQTWQKTFKN